MREAFTSHLALNKANKARLEQINGILIDYASQGYRLTLRQLYYQLVSKDVIANNVKEYGKLSDLLKKGRMSGIVDWSSIEDRGRQERIQFAVDGIAEGLEFIHNQYKRDRMEGQPHYMEIWIEKDALSNIFSRLTNEFHIPLMVNKGYSSCSAMYEAANRFKNREGMEDSYLFYFGDHDASGKDMVRDIRERMEEFRVENLHVVNPALNMDQIEQYEPPENPQKSTDPRAAWYFEKYGTNSWELDALTPQVLLEVAREAITPYIDFDQYNAALEQEADEKQELAELIERYKEGNE